MEGTIIPTWIFYAIPTIQNIKTMLGVVGGVGGVVLSMVLFFLWIDADSCHDDDQRAPNKKKETVKKWLAVFYCLAILALLLPSERTMYVMLANSFLTYESVDAFVGNAEALVDYIFAKIAELR